MPTVELAIEISNPGVAAGVALRIDSGEPIAEPLDMTDRATDPLMPTIAAMFDAAGLSPSDLTSVAVSLGPGGFTSIRVAAMTAKMLSATTGAKLIPIRTAAALAYGQQQTQPGEVAVALAWKLGDMWLERYRQIDPASPESLAPTFMGVVRFDAVSEHLESGGVLIGEEVLRERLPNGGASVALVPPQFDPRWLLALSPAIDPVDPHALLPIYPREPEAVTKWRALHGTAPGDPPGTPPDSGTP